MVLHSVLTIHDSNIVNKLVSSKVHDASTQTVVGKEEEGVLQDVVETDEVYVVRSQELNLRENKVYRREVQLKKLKRSRVICCKN